MKKILTCLLSALALGAVAMAMPKTDLKTANASESTDETTHVQTFDDVDEKKYEAFFSSDGETATEKAFSEVFEADGGKLSAKSATGYSSLLCADYAFLNFEMSFDYQSDNQNNGYLALVGRVREKGLSTRGEAAEAYKGYGLGVFVTDDGNFRACNGSGRCNGYLCGNGYKKEKKIIFDGGKL